MTSMTPRLPWLPPGATAVLPGRGEVFYRWHRHPDPSAPVLILLHGWTASADLQFFSAYRQLAERCSFVALDHRGHGRGIRPATPVLLEDCADDAAALVRQLGLGPVVLVGYSMGGPISCLLAQRHPDLVGAMVLEATALEWRATLPERLQWRLVRLLGLLNRSFLYPRWLRTGLARLMGAGHELEPYLPWMIGEIRRNDPWMVVEAGRALSRYDARSWAGSLGVPTGVLVTTDDHLVRPRKQWALAEVTGARATGLVAELPADHLGPWEHPGAWAAATVDLVERVVASGLSRRQAS